jgi:hypothetical protein
MVLRESIGASAREEEGKGERADEWTGLPHSSSPTPGYTYALQSEPFTG